MEPFVPVFLSILSMMFGGIVGNRADEFVMNFIKSTTGITWKELLFQAFQQAVENYPEYSLDEDKLWDVLQLEDDVDDYHNLQQQEQLEQLIDTLITSQILTTANDISPDQYHAFVEEVVGNAKAILRQAIEDDEQAFRKAAMDLLENNTQKVDELLQNFRGIQRDTWFDNQLLNHFRLVDVETFETATPDEVTDFYTGKGLLKWQIIKADAIIQRDQEAKLLSDLSVASSKLEIVCIAGQMGDGKSSFAWKLALQVAKKLGCPLLQALSNEDSECWIALENYFTLIENNIQKSVVILVDDMFRDESFLNSLSQMRTDLPIKVIATSRLNEIPNDRRLKFDVVELESPSNHEKDLIRKKLGNPSLNRVQRKRLEEANNWLVLMMELTTGESWQKVIKKNIKRLQELDDDVYRAYQYICFAGQYDVSISEDLLNALDQESYFWEIYDRPAASGLIFTEHSKKREIFLKTAHAWIAKESLKEYRLRNPQILLKKLADAIDINSTIQRSSLLLILVRMLTEGQRQIVEAFLSKESIIFEQTIKASGHTELINNISILLGEFNQHQLLEQVKQQIVETIPNDTHDWESKIAYIRRYVPEVIPKNIDQLSEWLTNHDEDLNARSSYLSLVKSKGSNEQIQKAINDTQQWLQHHPEDVSVRDNFLSIVKEKGTDQQIQAAIDNTRQWLQLHQEDLHVRSHYLILVKDKGSQEQTHQAIENMQKWLQQHHENVNVRSNYLILVKDKGSQEQIHQAIESAQKWLQQHNDDKHVRQSYLSLVKDKATKPQIQIAINDIRQWLQQHDDDEQVRESYFVLIEQKGTKQQIHSALEDTQQWLQQYDGDGHIRQSYISLVKQKGTKEQIHSALEDTRQWLQQYDGDEHIRQSYISLVKQKGTKEQIHSALEDTRQWLQQHDNEHIWQSYINLVKQKGSKEQTQSVIKNMQQQLEQHDNNSNIRGNYLSLIQVRGTEEQIKMVIDDTYQWLKRHDDDSNIRGNYLSLIQIRGTEEQIKMVIDDTYQWLKQHENINVRIAFLSLLRKRGAEEQIKMVIDDTYQWLKQYENINVRSTFLSLIKEKGTTKQIKAVIDDTYQWLKRHDDMNVRTNYLSLVQSNGTKQQIQDAIAYAQHWFANSTVQDFGFWISYGSLLYQQGLFTDAKQVLKRVVSSSVFWAKSHVTARITYAWCCYELDDFKAALEELKAADKWAKKRDKEKRFQTQYNLGVFYQKQKRYTQAISHFNESLLYNADESNTRIEEVQQLIDHAKALLDEG